VKTLEALVSPPNLDDQSQSSSQGYFTTGSLQPANQFLLAPRPQRLEAPKTETLRPKSLDNILSDV
jgi:hypothetical protein